LEETVAATLPQVLPMLSLVRTNIDLRQTPLNPNYACLAGAFVIYREAQIQLGRWCSMRTGRSIQKGDSVAGGEISS
jgi:hypothetical protein